MSLDWQTLVTLFVVLGAAGVLVRRVQAFMNPTESGCGGGCSGCESSSSTPTGKTLVSLSLPPQKADQAR
ncbi:MAG: FeoB-associated Cys-rich membrane protein [Planctomycetota bacterium]|nr:MAG: FeoB-associated Cys-rich membrane protein [Planctomycetota bacterium]